VQGYLLFTIPLASEDDKSFGKREKPNYWTKKKAVEQWDGKADYVLEFGLKEGELDNSAYWQLFDPNVNYINKGLGAGHAEGDVFMSGARVAEEGMKRLARREAAKKNSVPSTPKRGIFATVLNACPISPIPGSPDAALASVSHKREADFMVEIKEERINILSVNDDLNVLEALQNFEGGDELAISIFGDAFPSSSSSSSSASSSSSSSASASKKSKK